MKKFNHYWGAYKLTKASVIIVTYNHKKYIKECIESVQKQTFPHEIIIVDNCSSDGTAKFVKRNFPLLKVLECKQNLGYCEGNNLGVRHANGEYVVVLNPDTIAECGWLRELVKPLENNNKLITTPKILLYDGSAINTCGNINHFTGLTFTRGLGEKPESYSKPEYVTGISGCCFAMRRKGFLGFDKAFFIYNDDSDFSWKAHLKGFKIMYVPSSVVRHDYTLQVSPEKIWYLERNRYLILKKCLSKKNLLIMLPSLLLAELLTLGYAMKCGRKGVFYKLKAVIDGLRTEVDKVYGDRRNLLESLGASIPVDQLTSNGVERMLKVFVNKVFKWNYGVIR